MLLNQKNTLITKGIVEVNAILQVIMKTIADENKRIKINPLVNDSMIRGLVIITADSAVYRTQILSHV
jgi:hypothetical protein